MNTDGKHTIGVLLFEALDVFGPVEMCGALADDGFAVRRPAKGRPERCSGGRLLVRRCTATRHFDAPRRHGDSPRGGQ